MFLPLQHVEERPEHSQSSTEGAPCFSWDNHSESVLQWHCYQTFSVIAYISDVVFLSFKQKW